MPNQIDITKEIISKWQKIINNDQIFKQKLWELLNNVNDKNNLISEDENPNHIEWKREHYHNKEILSSLLWYPVYLKDYNSEMYFTQTSVKQACEEILTLLK